MRCLIFRQRPEGLCPPCSFSFPPLSAPELRPSAPSAICCLSHGYMCGTVSMNKRCIWCCSCIDSNSQVSGCNFFRPESTQSRTTTLSRPSRCLVQNWMFQQDGISGRTSVTFFFFYTQIIRFIVSFNFLKMLKVTFCRDVQI